MIREATHADLTRCVEMGRHFWASSGYGFVIRENPAQMQMIGERLVDGTDGVLLVSERDGQLTGMIGMLIFPHPLSAQRTAGELFYWVEPESRGDGAWLLIKAEHWAQEHGAEIIQMIEPVHMPRVAKLYRRLGYAEIERGWSRSV